MSGKDNTATIQMSLEIKVTYCNRITALRRIYVCLLLTFLSEISGAYLPSLNLTTECVCRPLKFYVFKNMISLVVQQLILLQQHTDSETLFIFKCLSKAFTKTLCKENLFTCHSLYAFGDLAGTVLQDMENNFLTKFFLIYP